MSIGWPGAVYALGSELQVDLAHSLPDLPAEGAPGRFSLNEQSATLGYHSRDQKWSATLDEYAYLNPGLKIDYGMLLTNKFGAGATLTHHTGYSEVLVNGIYAPRRNLRLRVAGGQLRAPGDHMTSDAVTQNSYLIDVKKNAGSGRLLSDIGMTAYTVRANDSGGGDYGTVSAPEEIGTGPAEGDAGAAGRLDGYTLNLGLEPTPYSRIELRRERTHFSYRYGRGIQGGDYRDVNHVRYSQYLSNCARFQTRYSAGEDYGRVDLSLAKNRWNVGVSHSIDSSVRDTMLQVGYSIPLGRAGGGADKCASPVHAFGALVDATVTRPSLLPSGPIVNAIPY
jgi:hypothetical protein